MDGVLVVLDHDERVTRVPQAGQGFDEPTVITLVQADGSVQHVEHAHQAYAPICVARRIRWASPPDSVAAARSRLR